MTLKSLSNLLTLALALQSLASPLPSAAKAGSSTAAGDDPGCRSCVSRAATLFASNQLEPACRFLREWSKKCPRNAQVHLLLSTILIRLGASESAEAEKEASLACAAQEDSQAAHLQYANCLLALKKYAQAAREFETVTSLNPGSYEAWSELGELYKRLRRDDEAAKAAEKAACLEPATQAIRMSVLQNLKKAGRLSQAKAELKRLLAESKSAPEFEQLLVGEAIQLGAYPEAVEACKQVLESYPNSSGPLKSLMIAQLLQRDFTEAEQSAAGLLTHNDRSAEVLAMRALCRLQLGKTEEAEADLKSAQALDPASGFVMLTDGLLKMAKGDFENAAELLKYAGESSTKGSQADKVPQSLAHLSLSRLNRKQGLLQEAVQEAHAAGNDRRFLSPALALEARALLVDKSRPDGPAVAAKLAQQALTGDAQEPEALLARSFCEMSSGKFSEARPLASKAAQLAPGDADANLALALIAGQESDGTEQEQQLQKGLKAAAQDPELLYELGRLYLKSDKAREAIPVLKQAVEHRARSAEICFALAEAFEKNGDGAESLKYYKQSLSQGLAGDDSTRAKAAIGRLESGK